MIRLKFSIIFLLFFIITSLKAQQFPVYSQYVFNEYVINSAVAGTIDKSPIRLTYRDQWTSNWFYGKKNILKSQKLASNDFDIIQKEILILINEELGT